jgi:hypothetical protein
LAAEAAEAFLVVLPKDNEMETSPSYLTFIFQIWIRFPRFSIIHWEQGNTVPALLENSPCSLRLVPNDCFDAIFSKIEIHLLVPFFVWKEGRIAASRQTERLFASEFYPFTHIFHQCKKDNLLNIPFPAMVRILSISLCALVANWNPAASALSAKKTCHVSGNNSVWSRSMW